MFFAILFFLIALCNATEETRLFKTNEALRQALQELQAVEQQQQEELSVGEDATTVEVALRECLDELSVGVGRHKYEKRAGIYKCPLGEELTEDECRTLKNTNDGITQKGWFDEWKGAGTWGSETCGCYLDNQGGRYFNRLDRGSSSCGASWWEDEKAICRIPYEDIPTRYTTGGTAEEGSTCVFPFDYESVTWYDCTDAGDHDQPWCYTESDHTRWGNCIMGASEEQIAQCLELAAVKQQQQQQEADELSVGQYATTLVTKFEKRAGIYKCPRGEELTESECKGDVPKSGFDTYKGAGRWTSETCGCYIDNSGGRYFNRLHRDSSSCGSSWWEKEKAICKKQVQVTNKCAAPNPFQFLEMQDGQCEFKLVYGSGDCPSGYEKILSAKDCQAALKNSRWGGTMQIRKNRKTIAKRGCAVYKQSYGVGRGARTTYKGYYNTASDCNKCDNSYARVCKKRV